jgi:hypothetical protein
MDDRGRSTALDPEESAGSAGAAPAVMGSGSRAIGRRHLLPYLSYGARITRE